MFLTSLIFCIQKSEDEHFQVFELASQTNPYFERKWRLNFATFGCNLPPISKYRLNINIF